MLLPHSTRSIGLLLLSLLCVSAPVSAQIKVRDLADAVDHRYNNLHAMQAKFTERYTGAGLERNESGTLSLKKPGKMRWEYQAPRAKIFVSDGKTAWFYVPGENQARRTTVKQLDDLRTPLRYLLGHTKLEKEFTGLSLAPDVQPIHAGDIVLRGVPASMADRVSQVFLEISPEHRISGITVEELDGSKTEFQFTDESDNPVLPDAHFAFKPPEGVEIVQGTELNTP